MINVAYKSLSVGDPTSWYRCSGVLNHISHPELSFHSLDHVNDFDWTSFSGKQIFFFQRPFTEAHVFMIRLAKDMGIKVITDYDDDMLNVPSHNNTSITYEEQKKNTKMCVHLSDEVWVTTPALKQSFKPYNKNIQVVPNSHNDHVFPVKDKRPFNTETRHALYRGGPSHIPDLNQNINDIVDTINGNPKWRFMFMGLEESYKDIFNRTGKKAGVKDNVYYVPPMTIVQYFHYLFEENSNLGFFPLLNNKFNHSKSNISFLELTYSGACFMAPRCLPEFDMDFIVDIQHGLKEPFEEISKDYARMKLYNDQAWQWILGNRLLSEINKVRVERLLENGTKA